MVRRVRRRLLVAALCAAVVLPVAAAPSTAGGPPIRTSTVARGSVVRPTTLPRVGSGRTTPKAVRSARSTFATDAAVQHAAAVKGPKRAAPAGGIAASGPVATNLTPALGLNATSYGRSNLDDSADPEIAVSPNDIVGITNTWIGFHGRDEDPDEGLTVALDTFFGVPAAEAAWGGSVAWDQLHGRWVAATTTWEYDDTSCDEGWLVLAVSSTADPLGAWTRWRIPVGAHFVDSISLGLSDDLIVLGGNEYPLDPGWVACLGLPFSGARVRAIDWPDALDGGTLAVADLTPAAPRHHWSWRAARNVPGVGSDDAGTAAHLVVDLYDAAGRRWGDLGYASISGSVVGGTADLAETNVTASAGVPRLVGPPWTGAKPGYRIGPYLGEGGGIDEAPQSVTWRADRLLLTAATTCIPTGDTSVRTCLRVIELNTSGAPILVDDTSVGIVNQDDFLGAVGLTRNGTTILAYDRGEYLGATFRLPAETMSDSRPETFLYVGGSTLPASWSSHVRLVADPLDPTMGWTQIPARDLVTVGEQYALRGGVSASPSGSAAGAPWTASLFPRLDLVPDPDSPIVDVILSNLPDTSVIDGQTWLTYARVRPSSRHLRWGIADYGGNQNQGPHTIHLQWRTADGIVSPVVSVAMTVDDVGPIVTGSRGFLVPSTLGSTARVKYLWQADDGTGIGVGSYTVWSNNFVPNCICTLNLPPLATTMTLTQKVGLDYHVEVKASDQLGTQGESAYLWSKVRAVQNTSSSVRYGGTWTTRSYTSASGGSVRTATAAGAYAQITTTGVGFAIVATKGPGRGKAQVYVDGVLKGTIDLYRSTTAYRQVVWQTSFTYSTTHTIKLRVLGTSGRPRIDLDAFLVLEDHFSG